MSNVNDTPVATDDTIYAIKNTEFTSSIKLDANDTDIDGDILDVNAGTVTTAKNGTININTDGSYTYTPNTDFTGTDTADYTVVDGNGGKDSGTLTITVADKINVNPEETFTFDSNTNNTQIITAFDKLNDVNDSTSNNQTVILQTGNADTKINSTTYGHSIDLGNGKDDKIIFDTAQDIIFQGTKDGGVSDSVYRFLNVENFEIHQVGTLTGSDKSESITLTSNNFTNINLGADTDTLLISDDTTIDLSKVNNIEKIELGTGASLKDTVSIADLFDNNNITIISDKNHTNDSNDGKVTLKISDFDQNGDNIIDNSDYTSSQDSNGHNITSYTTTDGVHTIQIEDTIDVTWQ